MACLTSTEFRERPTPIAKRRVYPPNTKCASLLRNSGPDEKHNLKRTRRPHAPQKIWSKSDSYFGRRRFFIHCQNNGTPHKPPLSVGNRHSTSENVPESPTSISPHSPRSFLTKVISDKVFEENARIRRRVVPIGDKLIQMGAQSDKASPFLCIVPNLVRIELVVFE